MSTTIHVTQDRVDGGAEYKKLGNEPPTNTHDLRLWIVVAQHITNAAWVHVGLGYGTVSDETRRDDKMRR